VNGNRTRGSGRDVARIDRRQALAMLGAGAAWALPRQAAAQALPVIGYLAPEAAGPFASRIRAFHEGLAESGYVEGRNVAIEYRWADGHYGRLPALAAELANRNVDVIVAPGGAPVALAAKGATSKITIVFEMGGDPVTLGVVDSMSKPGGNLTGVSSLSVEVSGKRLEFMHDLLPGAGLFATVVNPTSPTAPTQLRSLQAAAETLGVRLQVVHASDEKEFEPIFASVSGLGAGGLVFTSDPYFALRSGMLAGMAIRHAVPTITQTRDFALAGGVLSYGGDFTQSHRRAGVYTGRILKGEKPADLPVQQVTKVELFVNLKAAAGLGLTVPQSLITAADVVIE
jgi:putative tryptophan/tyrosine transport system substrate-binding protein